VNENHYAGIKVKRLFAGGQWLDLSDKIALTHGDLFGETHYEIVTRDGRWLLVKPEAGTPFTPFGQTFVKDRVTGLSDYITLNPVVLLHIIVNK